MKKKITITISFVLWFSLMSYSHGLKLKVDKQSPSVLIEAGYHGGMAIGDAEVKVFFNDVQTVFQKGKTDVHGRFSFIPDKAGTWYFQVDDGMGHRKRIKIEVDDDFFKQAVSAAREETGSSEDNNKSAAPDDAPDSEAGMNDASGREKPEDSKSEIARSREKNEAAAQPGSGGETARDGSIYCKILLGLVLIFAFTFIFYTYKRKKESK